MERRDAMAETSALMPNDEIIYHCSVCGGAAIEAVEQNCPHCGAAARTRSLEPFLLQHLAPELDKTLAASLPLMAFSMVPREEDALAKYFPAIQPVTLFGDYGPRSVKDIDARDLGRFADNSFSGHFSIVLFDYFLEHEKALSEAFRVLAPGGVFFTQFMYWRLIEGNQPPAMVSVIEKRPGYYDYVPDGKELLSIEVGAQWFLERMCDAGFEAEHVAMKDPISSAVSHWFRGKKTAAGAAAYTCGICGEASSEAVNIEDCPHCNSPSRTRSLPIVIDRHIAQLFAELGDQAMPLLDKPLLSFAMTAAERKVLSKCFNNFTSVSLYGDYGAGHQSGVDARDLSRFEDGAFSGVFSILLFDYFAEHEAAIREAARVTAPGGVFMTLILDGRVRDDDVGPVVMKTIDPRPGYFDYLPEGEKLLSVAVGRNWFLSTMRQAGFEADYVAVTDPISIRTSHWFIGRKPESEIPAQQSAANAAYGDAQPMGVSVAMNIAADALNQNVPDLPEMSSGTSVVIEGLDAAQWDHLWPGQLLPLVMTDDEALDSAAVPATAPAQRRFSIPLPRQSAPKLVSLVYRIPELASGWTGYFFADHREVGPPKARVAVVLLTGSGSVMVSTDNGDTWERRVLDELGGRLIQNGFICNNGSFILQAYRKPMPDIPSIEQKYAEKPTIYVYDSQWRFLGSSEPANAYWHGSASIGDADGTIMFAEYHDNMAKYLPPFSDSKEQWLPMMRANSVFRSRDAGLSWQKVFTKSAEEIRHFHTCAPDPFRKGAWWLSSGDQAYECRVWYSEDDGDTWHDVTNQEPSFVYPKSSPPTADARSCYRYTDVVVSEQGLLWGSDDLLGPLENADPDLPRALRSGSRLFYSPKSNPLNPVELAFCGMPIRNLVDIGPAFLVLTEAKYQTVSLRPQVFAVFKDRPTRAHLLFDVDNYNGQVTGLTYSKASRRAIRGRFFTYRDSAAAFPDGARLLQWDVSLR
jgi:SAM-dependent methyltransferase